MSSQEVANNEQTSPRVTQHRKKKSQQPKLVSTKKKQQAEMLRMQEGGGSSGIGTSSNIEQTQLRLQLQQQQFSQTQSLNLQNFKTDNNLQSMKAQALLQKKETNQISINSNANTFAFDIRQFHPMSPQIQSFTANHLKEKAGELEKVGTDLKNKKQSNHRRNQSKSQYAVPSSLNIKGGSGVSGIDSHNFNNKDDEDQYQMPSNEYIDNKDDHTLFKQIGNQKCDIDEQLMNPLGHQDSRNLRLKFNSLKTETFDKKSLEKLKKQSAGGGGPHQAYMGGESTDDVTSSKQLSHFKMGSSDKDSVTQNTNILFKFTPNSKKDHQLDQYSGGYNQETKHKRFTTDLNPQQFSLKNTPFLDSHQLLQKKVQVEEDNDNDDEEEEEDGFISDDNNYDNSGGMLIDHLMQQKRRQVHMEQLQDSDYDDEEEELKEVVGDLPPKIEDLQVVEYDEEGFQFGNANNITDDDEGNNDAPTVVIDSSLDDKDYAAEFRRMDSNDEEIKKSEHEDPMNNIAAALKSIKQQEEDDETKSKKKKVTIMSVDEEEALISQINEIRGRIKRGDTIGQQSSSVVAGSHKMQMLDEHQANQQQYYSRSQIDEKGLQIHFKSVDEVVHNNYQQLRHQNNQQQPPTASFNSRAHQQNDLKPQQQYTTTPITTQSLHNTQLIVQKPPLYSLTFAHPHDAEIDSEKNPLNGVMAAAYRQQQHQGFHSIDNNMPMNCIIMDGPNIFEKKKQRFERIQKLRGGTTNNEQGVNSEQMSYKQRSRDDITPVNGISSSVSANITSSQKKSVDSGSNKGSSHVNKRTQKSQQQQNSQQQPSSKTSKKVGSTKIKSQQIKPNQKSRQSQHINQVIGPIHSLSTQFQNQASSITDGLLILAPMQMMSIDDAISNGSHSNKRISNKNSKNGATTTISGSSNDNHINLYSLKKVSTTDKASRQSNQGTIKKKLLHKSKKVPFSISQPPSTSEGNSLTKGGKNIANNLIINVTQEPVLAQSVSIKRLKTPKLKLKDDLLHQPHDLLFNPKRLSEFQSVSTFKLAGGQSAKNNSSSYKNPFFQTLNMQSNRAGAASSIVENNKAEQSLGKQQQSQQEKRVSSSSFHKLKGGPSSSNQPQLVNNNIKSKSQVMCNIEPSFLTKLIKAKQETDSAFEAIKKKSSQVKFTSNNQNGTTSQSNTPNIQGTHEKNSFIEFEKKYRKLSGLINKIFS